MRTAVGHTDLEPGFKHLERLASATNKQAEYVKLLCEVVPEIFDGEVQLAVTLKIADLARHQLADRELAREYYKKALEQRADDKKALGALESLYEETGDAQNLLEILERRVEVAEGDEERKQLYESVKETYDRQTDPRYGAARLWIDAIIDPLDTRDAIIAALAAASLNPEVPKFSVGVLQT